VGDRYARCEVVKASSVLDAIDEIIKKLTGLGYLDPSVQGKRVFETLLNLKESEIQKLAETLSEERGYPVSMASRMIAAPIHQ
jgi:hypothetical protein